MKSLLSTVVCSCFANVFAVGPAVALPDDKLPVLKPKEVLHVNPKWSGTSAVAFSPDGTRVAVSANGGYGPNGIFVVWDIETGKKLLTVDADPVENAIQVAYLHTVQYSPNGKLIAAGGMRTRAKPGDPLIPFVALFDAQTGTRLRVVEARVPAAVYCVAFRPDGKRIVSGGGNSYDGRKKGEQFLTVWDVETGKELLNLKGHNSPVRNVQFSDDGKRIVSSDNPSSQKVRLWHAETGKELLTLTGLGDDEHRCIAVNRDGTRIVTGGRLFPVKLWDADTGKEVRTFSKAKAAALAFHPNGKWVIGAGRNEQNLASVVTIWDLASGREVAALPIHDSFVTGMALSADGKRVAVCFDDGHVSVWSFNAEP